MLDIPTKPYGKLDLDLKPLVAQTDSDRTAGATVAQGRSFGMAALEVRLPGRDVASVMKPIEGS